VEVSSRGLISNYYPGIYLEGLRETTNLSQGSRSSGRDLNPRPSKYESEVLTTWSLRSFFGNQKVYLFYNIPTFRIIKNVSGTNGEILYTHWFFFIFTLIMGFEFSKFQRVLSFVLQIIPVDNLKIENVAEEKVWAPSTRGTSWAKLQFTRLCRPWIPSTSLIKTKLTTFNKSGSIAYKNAEAGSVTENYERLTKQVSRPK
jgi:hypothetical protein